ncbi:MAG: ABC transporter ATP-binding protein [Acidobacteria bacterium]|nr:ABC transporter ATP-binding protein [Acidobacteriota bacterium]
MTEPILVVDHVSKTYGSGNRLVEAIRDISCTVIKNELLLITGRSGSGKSTLLYIMGALESVSAGKVLYRGVPLPTTESELAMFRLRHVGFVFQSFQLIPTLTAAQNVAVPMLLRGVAWQVARDRSETLLHSVDLGGRSSFPAGELSGGECQRVAIARALANDPSIVLADEPTGNLDSRTGALVMDLLAGLCRERHCAVVVVSHDPTATRVASRVISLLDGRVVGTL